MALENSFIDIAMDAVEAEANSGGLSYFLFPDSGVIELGRITLQADSMGASSAGVKAINPPNGEVAWLDYEMTVAADGTVDRVEWRKSDDTLIDTFTIGTSGTDFIVPTLAWTTGMIIRVTTTSPVYTTTSS